MSAQRASSQKKAKRQASKPSDFSEEYVGRQVIVTMDDGTAVEGTIVEARRYWFKVRTSEGRTIYVNKAFVKAIEVPK